MKKILSSLLFSGILFSTTAQPMPNSGSVMAAAYKQAAKQHKNVFVIFHASWCGWCRVMDASLTDTAVKPLFDKFYVTVHLDVDERPEKKNLENPGAEVFLAKYKADKAGLPFYMVFDAAGKPLADSFVNGESLGCPATADEVASFAILLKKTSSLSPESLKIIGDRFRMNEVK